VARRWLTAFRITGGDIVAVRHDDSNAYNGKPAGDKRAVNVAWRSGENETAAAFSVMPL
jgi:hypothetical protein